MAPTHVLRIPVAGNKDFPFVLIHVSSGGPKRLDLRLAATEGEAPYTLRLRQDRIDDLRSNHSQCSADEWRDILTALFLEQYLLENIDISAEISDSLIITIRKNIQGITQRLGALALKKDESHELDIVSWCSTAVESRDGLREQLAAGKRQIEDLDKAVEALRAQLDELLAAKQTDESELVGKFQKLLNEKKKKIRDQQRRLAHTSAAHKSEDAEPEEQQAGTRNLRGTKGATGQKRKNAPAGQAASSDSDDGFDKMEVDPSEKPARRDDQESEDHETTEQDTASEADEHEQPQPGSQHAQVRAATQNTAPKKDVRKPPPRREIPSLRNKAPAASTRSAEASEAKAGDSETDPDDDGL